MLISMTKLTSVISSDDTRVVKYFLITFSKHLFRNKKKRQNY